MQGGANHEKMAIPSNLSSNRFALCQGRMGLHYAAAIADHDDRGMYNWLTDEFSADEGKLDKVIN